MDLTRPTTIKKACDAVFAGMSVEILRSTYTQYDPDWQKDIADVDR